MIQDVVSFSDSLCSGKCVRCRIILPLYYFPVSVCQGLLCLALRAASRCHSRLAAAAGAGQSSSAWQSAAGLLPTAGPAPIGPPCPARAPCPVPLPEPGCQPCWECPLPPAPLPCSPEEAGLRATVPPVPLEMAWPRLGGGCPAVLQAALESDLWVCNHTCLYPRTVAAHLRVWLLRPFQLLAPWFVPRGQPASRLRKGRERMRWHKVGIRPCGQERAESALCHASSRQGPKLCGVPSQKQRVLRQSAEVGVQAAMGCPWSTGLRVPGPVVLSTASASPQAAIQSREC